MLPSNLEYITLRLARRFLFRDEFLLRFGRLIPHYRVNRNQADPVTLVEDYARHLAGQKYNPDGDVVVEIGTGATNSTGYEFAARFNPAQVLMLEPFVNFAETDDLRFLKSTAARHQQPEAALKATVKHLTTLSGIVDGTVDLVISSSVLEHVKAPDGLFLELRRVLKPGGAMLHLVDYRDHFFKYPYHFLQFSRQTWERWLDPGDLPRWRVYDHVESLSAAGFRASILQMEKLDAAFAQVAPHLSSDFRRTDPLLPVTYAALWANRLPD